MTNLRVARFSNNHLTLQSPWSSHLALYEAYSPFRDCISLEELYLAHNNVSVIYSDWMFNTLKLEILDLKYNNISVLSVSI